MLYCNIDKHVNIIIALSLALVSNTGLACTLPPQHTTTHTWMTSLNRFNPSCATFVFQAGGFNASQGDAQNIGINGLIGDHFSVAHDNGQNVLLGLGYYLNGQNQNRFSLLYGLNAFYFAQTTVQGNVTQERLFTNLSYHYSLTNYPIYAAIKALINTANERYTFTVDAGLGPNFIHTSDFSESSLDGGITLPDHIFSGQTNVAFSATAGIGVRFNNVLGHVPLEVGYRFFYLGQANLNKINPQVRSPLSTGDNYANALIVSIAV